jgi:hypothetical protein
MPEKGEGDNDMKDSWAVGVAGSEMTVYYARPTLEFLQEHATTGGKGYVQHIRPQPGVDVYCDEDAMMQGVPASCIIRWAPPVAGMEAAEVTLRGPVLFVFRTAKKQAEALAKLAVVLKAVVVPGAAGGPPELKYGGEGTKLPTVH